MKTREECRMVYEQKELYQIAAWLCDKYTSKESSSVPAETAQRLMGAVLYCLREERMENNTQKEKLPYAKTGTSLFEAYQRGYEAVVRKVYEAKELYNRLLILFDDYGCENCRDTVLKGIPKFFVNYEPRFHPQNHILTLDYPLLGEMGTKMGIDLIYQYLHDICVEQEFLLHFNREEIQSVLRDILSDYEECYLDNLCFPVLMRIMECSVSGEGRPWLYLTAEGKAHVREAFSGKDAEGIEKWIQGILQRVKEKGKRNREAEYLGRAVHDMAFLLNQGKFTFHSSF